MVTFKTQKPFPLVIYIFFIILIPSLFGCANKEIRKDFYQDGSLKSVAEFKGNIQDGERVEYYQNGNIKTKSIWRNGKQDGLAVLYYPNGNIESTTEWKDGKLEGYYEHYYEDGNRQEFGYYKNGVKDGLYTLFFQNGGILQEGSYRDGIRHGEQRVYDENGNLKSIKNFINFKGKEMLAGYVFFNEDGTIKEESARTEMDVEKDTVAIGEQIEVTIQLKNPHFDSTYYILGLEGFDEKFNLLASNNFDTLKAKEHKVTYRVLPKKSGKQYLRGYVNNFKIKDIQGDTVTTIASHTYFEVPFFVKQK